MTNMPTKRSHVILAKTLRKDHLHSISADELLALGVNDIAYVKNVEVDGAIAVAICAANGTQIALAPTFGAAVATAWQNGLAPMVVH